MYAFVYVFVCLWARGNLLVTHPHIEYRESALLSKVTAPHYKRQQRGERERERRERERERETREREEREIKRFVDLSSLRNEAFNVLLR